MKTVLYFGNIDMNLSRNKVYSDGLRQNRVQILVCTDRTPGIKKYWNLFKKHKTCKGKYDYVIVGYGGYVTVPFAKLLSNKPVIFDALCSFYETEILSRDAFKGMPFRMLYVRFIDWIATWFADYILVETNKQKEFFIRELRVKKEKLVTVYTGVDESVFKKNNTVEKYETFTALFRGRIMNEAGVPIILEAAKQLENKGIDFLIIGYGCNNAMREFKDAMQTLSPKNLHYIGDHLSIEELVKESQKCHVSLGQFANHERLKRTIPHKAYESLVLQIPYITARTEGVSEILEDRKHCLMVNPADPKDLAEMILFLKENKKVRNDLAEEAHMLFQERFTAKKIVQPLIDVIQ